MFDRTALQDVHDDALRPASGAADVRIPSIRLSVWIAASVGAYFFYPRTGAWPIAFAAACLTLPAFLATRRPALWRPLAIVGLAADLAAASLLVLLTGGFASPYAALYFVTTGEALVLFSTRGAVLAAIAASALGLVNLHAGVDVRAAVGYGLASGLLLLAAVLLGAHGRGAGGRAGTVLQPRTTEEVERQLSLLVEEHHRLKAVFRETAALARNQKSQIADLTLVRDALAGTLAAATAEEGMEHLLRVATSELNAPCAALWLADEGEPLLWLRRWKGDLAASLLHPPIRLDAYLSASAVRGICEERLASAAPRSPVPRGSSRDEAGASKDIPVCAHGLLLRKPQRVLGVVAVARTAPFGDDELARAAWLAEELAPAAYALVDRENTQRRLRYAEGTRLAWDAVSSCRDLGELCRALVEVASGMVQAQQATLFVLDALSGRLVPRASLGGVTNPVDHLDLGIGSGVSGWVASQRRRVLVPDLAAQKDLAGLNLVPSSVRSFLSVPMVHAGAAVGAISVAHEQPWAFRPADAQALEAIAEGAAPFVAQLCRLPRTTLAARSS
ncbi:MAG: GAF domain-containing protein [Chthonomonadales bacterium]